MPPEVIAKLVESGILGTLLVGETVLLVGMWLGYERKIAACNALLKAESDARLSDAKASTETMVAMQREVSTLGGRLVDAVELVAGQQQQQARPTYGGPRGGVK